MIKTVRLPGLSRLRRRVRGWAGVVSTPQGLEFAVARTENGHGHLERQSRVGTAAELRLQFDPREYRVATTVASEDVLCRTLSLPTTVPAELKQMLNLQIDQLTPLPPEEVVYDFESLGTQDGQTQVLVAIARKSAVNDRVAALEEAGLTAEVVGVAGLAVFRELVAKGTLPRDDKLGVVVSLRADSAVVILYVDGQPLVMRAIIIGPNAAQTAAGRQTLREELQRTLLAEQARAPQREPGRLAFHIQEEELRDAVDELSRGWGCPTDLLNDGGPLWPATSLCLDHVAATERRLNLLPEEWRRRRQTARLRRIWWRVATVLIVVYALAAIVFVAALAIRKSRLTRVQAEKAALETQFREARRLQSELNAMRLQLETKYSALDVLRQVSELMPPNAKMTSYIFRRDEAVTLKGQADNAQAVLDFISQLEQNELFSSVKTVSMATERAGGLTKYELLATLKSAAAKTTGVDHGAQ